MKRPLSLSDHQLALVMTAASSLPVEKRVAFLPRVAGRLERRGQLDDADVEAAIHAALRGLVQESAA
jgi:hypothetical protein